MEKKTKKTEPTPSAPRLHRMVVGRQPLHEDGRFHAAGSHIELSAARARALGGLIKPANGETAED